MRWILNHVDTPVIGILIVGAAVVVAQLLAAVTSRFRLNVVDNTGGGLDVVLAVVGAVYGIMLAFVIVDLWTNFNDARDTVSTEATALAQVEIDTRPMPSSDRSRIEAAITRYIASVERDEIPAMRKGNASPKTQAALDNLAAALEATSPQTVVQQTWYAEAVGKLNEVSNARRARVESARRDIPNPFRVLLFGGALVPIGVMTLAGVDDRRLRRLMVGVVAGLIAYALFLVVILEYPFSGTVTVSFEPFRSGVLAPLAP